MAEFLLEIYMPAWESPGAIEAHVRRAAAELADSGVAVRCGRATFVPADQLCWYLLESPSREAVAEVAERAGISPLRIVETAPTASGHSGGSTRKV